MTTYGYFLSSEETGPRQLLDQAQRAEQAGFSMVSISDHFHPWLTEQGESPFVWSVIGAIAATTRLDITTHVTCPTVRLHPAIVAQAAATSALLTEGRFRLGEGSGEALNETIFADRWPPADVRLSMLEEAVLLIRELLTGEEVNHDGEHYIVEKAKIWSCPPVAPEILVSAFGPKAAQLAARVGDGFIGTSPDKGTISAWADAGGKGTKQASIKFSYGPHSEECLRRAHRLWRTSGLPGQLAQDLNSWQLFEQATEIVTPEMSRAMPHGPDPEPYIKALTELVDAGYDEIYVNQIGADQQSFLDFWTTDLRPLLPS